MLRTEKCKHSNSLSHARVEYRDQINTNLYRYYFYNSNLTFNLFRSILFTLINNAEICSKNKFLT